MPIRFRCPQCQQRLSIGSHKSGTLIECPTCKEQVRVPEDSEISSSRASAAVELPSATGVEMEKQLDSTAIGMEVSKAAQAVPERGAQAAMPDRLSQAAPTSPLAWLPKLDASQVLVPRYVIYSQGLLLGAVGLVCLMIGIVLGWKLSPTSSPIDPATMPCIVRGRVEYEDSQGARRPDIGAMILALPVGNQPEKSISSEGLGVDDAPPKQDHSGLRELESLGARTARVDPTGRFEFRVPRGGKFFIVAISKTARRGDEPHKGGITSEIGKYVAPPTRLLGDHRYLMEDPTLREERTLDFVFTNDRSIE
jgi:hypothetical protein